MKVHAILAVLVLCAGCNNHQKSITTSLEDIAIDSTRQTLVEFPQFFQGTSPKVVVLGHTLLPMRGPSDAFAVLQAASRFNSAAVGFGGAVTKEACAMHVLAKTKNPEEWFMRLKEENNAVTRLYGFAGICTLGQAECQAQAIAFPDSQRVETLSGCLGGNEYPSAIVTQMKQSGALQYIGDALRCKSGNYIAD